MFKKQPPPAVGPDDETQPGVKHPAPPPLPARPPDRADAPAATDEPPPFTTEQQYVAYWERKKLNTAVPPPNWTQLDDIERASWDAATAAAIATLPPPPVTEP